MVNLPHGATFARRNMQHDKGARSQALRPSLRPSLDRTPVLQTAAGIAPYNSLRAAAHTCLPADGITYQQTAADAPVMQACGFCDVLWPMRGMQAIVVGHPTEVCRECRRGKARCMCPDTVFAGRASVHTMWLPMTRKVNGCWLCADTYNALYIRAGSLRFRSSTTGELFEPYLDDTEVSKARFKAEKLTEARRFYDV